MYLKLNNLQCLICYKTKANEAKTINLKRIHKFLIWNMEACKHYKDYIFW